MAKKKTRPMESADQIPGAAPAPKATDPLEDRQPEATQTATRTVTSTVLTCSVPFLEGLNGYKRQKVYLRLSGGQAEKLKGIMYGLIEDGAELSNGTTVTTQHHAIQWMIENSQ